MSVLDRALGAVFADRSTVPVAAVLATVLALCGLYWAYLVVYVPVGYWAALEDPAAHDGEPEVISLYFAHDVRPPDHFLLYQTGEDAKIEGTTEGMKSGDIVSVGGRFRASDETLVADWVEIHHEHHWKTRIGMLGVAFIVLMSPVWFTIRGGRVVERG